jgi:hypothetical protein
MREYNSTRKFQNSLGDVSGVALDILGLGIGSAKSPLDASDSAFHDLPEGSGKSAGSNSSQSRPNKFRRAGSVQSSD